MALHLMNMTNGRGVSNALEPFLNRGIPHPHAPYANRGILWHRGT